MALIDTVVPEEQYHGNLQYGRRQTVVYKKVRGKLELRKKRKYLNVPAPGRNGPTLVSHSFTKYPSDLIGAPFLPKGQVDMLKRIAFGRDRHCPDKYSQYYIDLFRAS